MDTTFIKPTLVTITAPTASGKSYLLDKMTKTEQPLFSRIVSTTTRPKREGEVEGLDYFFISREKSEEMESLGLFAELIEFRGIRYGVTKAEMNGKMAGKLAPIVVLEPQGLEIYKKMCTDNGWDIFKMYVSTIESLRIERLCTRTAIDIRNRPEDTAKLIFTHTDRLLSITGDERRWSSASSWDAIIPGDNADQAINDIKQAIKWRNYRSGPPST